MKKLVTIQLVMLKICILIAIVYWLFDHGFLRLNYPSHERFPIQGIDVSHHQGEINWKKLKSQKIQFAFIKATEGGDHVDRKFFENWSASKAAGIIRGAYHFFTFCKSGIEQAQNFLRVVPYEQDALPIVIDLEFGGNCSREMSEVDLAKEVTDFVHEAQITFSSQPIFYVTSEFFDRYLKDHAQLFPPHTLWLRNIFLEPQQSACERWTIWQFANRGRLDGITGPVDLNAFCGGQADFERLFGNSRPR